MAAWFPSGLEQLGSAEGRVALDGLDGLDGLLFQTQPGFVLVQVAVVWARLVVAVAAGE